MGRSRGQHWHRHGEGPQTPQWLAQLGTLHLDEQRGAHGGAIDPSVEGLEGLGSGRAVQAEVPQPWGAGIVLGLPDSKREAR